MSRLTDNDKRLGPLTIGKAGWNPISLRWSDSITAYLFGWAARLDIPRFVRLSGEYGFMLCDGHFNIYYGRQTHDSSTEQRWGFFLPWTQWRFVRISLYDLAGVELYSEGGRERDYERRRIAESNCPKARFEFDDYDGKRIIATTHIEEREWRFGTGYFQWLSLFRRPRVSRSLAINYSEEVGKDKGSWKGGTVGCGIDMMPNETAEAAFRRHCEKSHRAKGGKYELNFVGTRPDSRRKEG